MSIREEDFKYMQIAEQVAEEMSTCQRGHTGSILVKKKEIILAAGDGTAGCIKSCAELKECPARPKQYEERTGIRLRKCICAERKLISLAARDGIAIGGGTMYVTKKPCLTCAPSIIDAGIERVIYDADNTDTMTSEMMKEANIEFLQLK